MSGSGKVAVSGNVQPNVIVEEMESLITDSTVNATGSVKLSSLERAPVFPPGDLFDLIPASVTNEIQGILDDTPLDLNVNVLTAAVTISGAGNVAAGATFSINNIVKTVRSQIDHSTVTAVHGDVMLDADSESRITAFTAGS